MNSISQYLWDLINKYLGIRYNRPATYAAIILEMHQVSSSVIRNVVNELRKMSLIKEPGQDVETFGYQVIKETRCIVGSGSALSDITYIFYQCLIKCDALAFKLKALQFYNIVDDDPTKPE